jgi:hypothetical protein
VTSNPKKLIELLVKVDRAKKHLIDLQLEVNRFFRPPYPYEILSEDNRDTRERTYYLRVHKETPSDLSTLIGDVAQNLRSALDHLAWHLVKNSPVTPKTPDRRIYFPIFETAEEYRRGKSGKIQGVTGAAIEAIDVIKPYYRLDGVGIGNPALYWLSEINIQDKHRLLIPVWTAAPARSITKSRRLEMANVLLSAFGSESTDVMVPSLVPPGPLEDGSKLCTLPISEVDDNMKFRFQVAFGEPEGIRGKEIISTLSNMHRIVKEIMFDFDAKGLL